MKTFWQQQRSALYHGDMLKVLGFFAPNCIDTVITDPPYHLTNRTPDVKCCKDCNRVLGGSDGKPEKCPRCGGELGSNRAIRGGGFMGQAWDGGDVALRPETWQTVMRVCRPGAFLLAFGGTRTYHRMTCAIEDAGWEIRDCICWLYGSGFPKSHNFGKGDKTWDGWGTALKPAWEPIIVAMKPLDGTFEQNAEKWGVAGLNIDAGRIVTDARPLRTARRNEESDELRNTFGKGLAGSQAVGETEIGRWPANLILDEQSAAALDEQAGDVKAGGNLSGDEPSRPFNNCYGDMNGRRVWQSYGDFGGPSRFFYCAKASRAERNAGLDHLPTRNVAEYEGRNHTFNPTNRVEYGVPTGPKADSSKAKNHHPTVKPIALMEYLCKLTSTPTGGVVLDPFAGSGSTLIGAHRAGRPCIGIEMQEDFCAIAAARAAYWMAQKPQAKPRRKPASRIDTEPSLFQNAGAA